MSDKNEQLTNKQKELVVENHNLIYGYAYKKGILLDDYYDVLAIGLCKAAKSYDSDKSEFSTFAFKCMDNEMNTVSKNKKTVIPNDLVVSYDSQESINNISNGLSFAETISDFKYHESIVYDMMTNEIMNSLTKKESIIFKYLISGLTHREIASEMKCNRSNVTYFANRIRKKVNDYLSQC